MAGDQEYVPCVYYMHELAPPPVGLVHKHSRISQENDIANSYGPSRIYMLIYMNVFDDNAEDSPWYYIKPD